MAKVVIQPSFGNRDARQHWADTLAQEVDFSTGRRKAALTREQFDALRRLAPGESARFWGATSNHDAKMATLRTGDVILFTGGKRVRAVGEVGHAFRNAAFADTLWDPHPQRGSYLNVYSLLAFEDTDIPYEEIWDLPGFNEGDNFMGLRFLDSTKGDTILAGLAISTVTEAQLRERQESQTIQSLRNGGMTREIGAEAVNVTHTSYERPRGVTLVHRAEALLVQRYREGLSSALTAGRIRTPVGIADLYVKGGVGPEIIEAKRGAGHQFVRQALAQLLDYVLHSPEPVQRLTGLFPVKPSDDDVELLARYGIDCVYLIPTGEFVRRPAPDARREYMMRVWSER